MDAERISNPAELNRRKKHLATRIDEIRGKLKQEGLQLKLNGGREENPYYQQTKQNIDNLDVEVKGLAKQKEKLAEARVNLEKSLAAFEAVLPALSTLELDAHQKRAFASRLADGVASMRTVQRLEQLNLSNIQVMHAGTFEPLKIGPQRGKQVFLAGFAGAVVGAMLALLLAWRDPRLRGPHDLIMLGVPADGLRTSGPSKRKPLPSSAAIDSLPPEFQEVGHDIARFWATLPYDHRTTEGLKIAFLPCGEDSNASLAAATLAIGLAAYGGERVVYVSCAGDDNWFAKRLGFEEHAGWSEVVRDGLELKQAIAKTCISGLSYLPMGSATESMPHPIAGPAFGALLDQLSASYRFVVVEMPNLGERPEGQSVLGVVDAAELVVCKRKTSKDAVREAVTAVKTAGARMLGAVVQSASTARQE